jgi:hypothetical protein
MTGWKLFLIFLPPGMGRINAKFGQKKAIPKAKNILY